VPLLLLLLLTHTPLGLPAATVGVAPLLLLLLLSFLLLSWCVLFVKKRSSGL
jgi:hypothetical protein